MSEIVPLGGCNGEKCHSLESYAAEQMYEHGGETMYELILQNGVKNCVKVVGCFQEVSQSTTQLLPDQNDISSRPY